MSVKTAALITDGSSFTVAPGEIIIYPGDLISFHNLTNEPAIVMIPDKNLFGESEFPVGPNGTVETAMLPKKFTVFGSYPYAVYFPGRREFAHASMPMIIIYPIKP